MVWKIEFEKRAERDLAKLDPQVARRIIRFVSRHLGGRDDPREPLRETWVDCGGTG